VRAAVLADPELTERQKQVLLEIYESFRRELAARAAEDAVPAGELESAEDAEPVGIEPGGMVAGEPGPNGEVSQVDDMAPDVAGLGRDANPVPE
jgi:hypothetical protein